MKAELEQIAGTQRMRVDIMLVATPIVIALTKPRDEDAIALDIAKNPDPEPRVRPAGKLSFARRLEYSRAGSLLLGFGGVSFLVMAQLRHTGAFSSVNAVIFVMFVVGVVLHGYPLAYGDAVKNAAPQAGAMMLQYPLYGGVMGIMAATGLPDVISHLSPSANRCRT